VPDRVLCARPKALAANRAANRAGNRRGASIGGPA